MKKPSKEKLIMWVLVFLALAGLTVRFLHREYSLASVLSSIKEADPIWLLPGVGAMALFFVCEGANIGRSLRLAGHNISRIDEIRYAMAGFFFSSITPSASGGQPMQLYFRRKHRSRRRPRRRLGGGRRHRNYSHSRCRSFHQHRRTGFSAVHDFLTLRSQNCYIPCIMADRQNKSSKCRHCPHQTPQRHL